MKYAPVSAAASKAAPRKLIAGAGTVHGATDEIGLHAIENRLHVHDLHATILSLLGLDLTKVIYSHSGRPERVDAN